MSDFDFLLRRKEKVQHFEGVSEVLRRSPVQEVALDKEIPKDLVPEGKVGSIQDEGKLSHVQLEPKLKVVVQEIGAFEEIVGDMHDGLLNFAACFQHLHSLHASLEKQHSETHGPKRGFLFFDLKLVELLKTLDIELSEFDLELRSHYCLDGN